MSSSQRTKGANFERWCARKLQHVFPQARRNLTETQTGGQGVDLALGTTGAFAVQCKRHAKYAPITAIEEVNAPGYFPLLITKGDRTRTMAVLPLDALLAILDDVAVGYDEPQEIPF